MGSADTGSPRDRGADDGRASPGHWRLGIAGVACRRQPSRCVSGTCVGTASRRSAPSASGSGCRSECQSVLGRPSRGASSRSRADLGLARTGAARGGFPVMGSPGRATRRRTRARGRPTYRGPHARGVGEPSGSTPGVGRARRGARRRRRGSAGGSVLVVMEPAGRARLGCPAGSRGVTRVAGHL